MRWVQLVELEAEVLLRMEPDPAGLSLIRINKSHGNKLLGELKSLEFLYWISRWYREKKHDIHQPKFQNVTFLWFLKKKPFSWNIAGCFFPPLESLRAQKRANLRLRRPCVFFSRYFPCYERPELNCQQSLPFELVRRFLPEAYKGWRLNRLHRGTF